jgi:hypothetical protein
VTNDAVPVLQRLSAGALVISFPPAEPQTPPTGVFAAFANPLDSAANNSTNATRRITHIALLSPGSARRFRVA